MIIKKNKVKLQRGDVRVGNFVYHAERDHYKLTDINGLFSVRIAGHTPMGMMMRAACDDPQGNDTFLHNYAAVIYNALSSIPDGEWMTEVNRASLDAVSRHREMYGIREDVSSEEDEAILRGVRETEEAIEGARKELGIKTD